MPNHVTNKITFEASKADQIIALCCKYGQIDFKKLIPQPTEIYLSNLSSEDIKDFPCNWSNWNRENWGTKWNAYGGAVGREGDSAYIKFDTAWSVPYPIISAFANIFKVPFVHKYCDEFDNFWGIEVWSVDEYSGPLRRTSKRKALAEDKVKLHEELIGLYEDDDGEQRTKGAGMDDKEFIEELGKIL